MARDGSGTYAAPSNSWNPAVEGTIIDESDWDDLLNDLESALTESVFTSGLGSTDNRLLRTDGTGTKKAQGSAVTLDDSGNLTGLGYLEIPEASAPSSPSANNLRLYVADSAGVTKLYAKDSAGTVTSFMDVVGTVTSVNLTAPAAGITVSGGPITTSGSITLALADDLAALEALASTGIAARTGSSTWAQRTITAGTGITVTNGDGASGNPIIAQDINGVADAGGFVSGDKLLIYDASAGSIRRIDYTDLPGASGGITNGYASITDGTTAANASGADTFKIRGGYGIDATVQNNDATHGDNVNIEFSGADANLISTTVSAANYTASASNVSAHLDGIDDALDTPNSPTNYTPTNATIAGHLTGIDTKLGTLATYKPGDIMTSLDATPQSGFVELDGATISGGAATYPGVAARYPWMVVSGNIVLPDFRGRVLRAWADGSSNDPDRAARTARAGDGQTGDFPGTYQGHQYQSHDHSIANLNSNPVGSQAAGGALARTVAAGTTGASGGNETRMINVAVAYQMKVG